MTFHAVGPEMEGERLWCGDAQGIGPGLQMIRRNPDTVCAEQCFDIPGYQLRQI